jgi:Domain of unknown function (DUF4386)
MNGAIMMKRVAEASPRSKARIAGALCCLLIGYLIFRSTFLPRILGAMMVFAGLGWLTYMSTLIANNLSPYNLAAGLLGEGLVMLWFLVMGVNAQKWKDLLTERERSPRQA